MINLYLTWFRVDLFFFLCFSLAKESDFDLDFPSKSTANYAKYTSMPSLTEFTACAWVKMISSVTGTPYFFTYSTSSNYEAIGLGYETGRNTLHTNIANGGWQ